MRRFASAATAALLVWSATPFAQAPVPPDDTSSSPTAFAEPLVPVGDDSPHGWFVELGSLPTADGGEADALDADEVAFRQAAAQAGIDYTETRRFRDLWNGLSIDTSASADILRSLPGVAAVYPVLTAQRAQSEDHPADSVADMVTALAAGGADVAQNALGLSGTGIRVAVMDSGIDYNHPDLGGCFGDGCRVAKGWDFVGDAFNPDRTSPLFNPVPRPDANPDDCDGHGTHVAGIIGANGTIRGVAPGVTLHAYRVFGCDGPTTTDIILAAMERAYLEGADVLNVSLGAPYQWPDYPTAASASRLVRKGLFVVASGGNTASGGLYASDAPGVGKGVISVASFDNPAANIAAFRVSPDGVRVGYAAALGSAAVPTTGSVPVALAASIEACAPLPAGSLNGRAALVRRGTCGFPVKAANARAAGAAAVIIADNIVEGRITIDVGTGIRIPAVMIKATDGALLASRLAGGPVTLTWTTDVISEPQATGNRISSFSSYGPTPSLSIKPDLGAPGGAIRSTIPVELGSFGTISGTSMASPYIAGAVALLMEAHPGLTPTDAVVRLQNTARPQFAPGSTTARDLVHRQGAGLVDVAQAVTTAVTVTPSRLNLGDFDTPAPIMRRLELRAFEGQPRNRGPHPHGSDWHDDPDCPLVTYSVSHEPALASGPSTFTPTTVAAFAIVEFSTPAVVVGGGESGDGIVNVLITPPANSTARLFGGYLRFTPDDSTLPTLRVPYLGYNGDYQAIQALTPTSAGFPWLARISGTTLVNQPVGATYTMANGDAPIVAFHLDHQVRILRADVFRVVGTEAEWLGVADRQDFVARNTTPTSFFLLTWNGTYFTDFGEPTLTAPNGTYRLLIRALKARGDKANEAHYEEWMSPDIQLAR